jgi:uncharacterized protein
LAPSLKLFAVTDFHGSVESAKNLHATIKSEGADLALVCGDISDFGDAADVQFVLQTFYGEIPGFYVTGNCDPPELLTKGVPSFEERNLHARTKLVGTTVIAGLGGSTPTPSPTPTQLREDEILRIMLRLGGDIQEQQHESLVFLFHNPPYNTKTDLSSTGSHAGSRILRDFILQLKPQVVFHGHIHEARGIDKIGETYVVNPGPAFLGYYALATLEGGRVTVELKEA